MKHITEAHPRDKNDLTPMDCLRRPSHLQRGILWLTLGTLILQPIAVSAQVIATTAGANGPQVGTAQNGITVVQINAPSGAGVSRNQYQQFDVPTRGIVLNNSPVVTRRS